MISAGQARALGFDRWKELVEQREEIIRLERMDPLNHGWEPKIWKVADALLGWGDPEYGKAMRQLLGFEAPVSTLLINGGNRGSKSEYAAKRLVQILARAPGRRAWAFHSKRAMSVDYQMPIVHKYLPAALQHKKIMSETAYIHYKAQTGFSGDKFTLPNLSDCSFWNYEMDRTTIEGGEIDYAWPDELVPPDWVETLEFRTATREGKIIITFTPILGYSQTVKLFQDGAVPVRFSTAFLVPVDGKEALHDLALVPEDCDKWLEGETGQPVVSAGRKFKKVPRVMRCAPRVLGGRLVHDRAVIFFHTSDNPFGNPASVLQKVA
jgi:phage terminase large subunit-like protein